MHVSVLCTASVSMEVAYIVRTDISAQKHAEEDAVARANLVEKLALRTQEAAQHERNFQQMAELAPCGMSRGNAMLWPQLTTSKGCLPLIPRVRLRGQIHNV